MIHSWRWLLDQLFPPRETELRVRNTSDLAAWYQPARVDEGVTLADYRDPVIRASILENKFWANEHATRLLAGLLAQWLPDEPVTIVPIPLSSARLRERGYNQVEQIVRAMPSRSIAIRHALKRVRHTPPQMDLSRTRRLKNLDGAFAYRPTRAIRTHRVVLLDDVLTTGATMRAAQAALAPHLPPQTNLTCVSLAH